MTINPPKTYEEVLSVDKKDSNNKLDLKNVSAIDMTELQYRKQFQTFIKDMFDRLFYDSVRLSWLRRSFVYFGHRTIYPIEKNPMNYNVAFVKYVRRIIGKDIQIITRSRYFSKLETYYEEFFPGFVDGNPFENPEYYKFPFKNISVEYLLPVHQLDDRIELLKEADRQCMSYAVFIDYIINYCSLKNEELNLKVPRYQVKMNVDQFFPFYIRDRTKSLQTKKGEKRKYAR